MSHTRVKTTYAIQAAYGSTEIVELYCHHNHSCDITIFYNKDGSIASMCFEDWETGNNLYDAMERLLFPFKDEWGGELKDKVEYYFVPPWEIKNTNPHPEK